MVQATTLAHTLFLNRGDHFEPHALPDEWQFAPAFGAVVADFDGDGNEDLFLSQNFFAYPVRMERADSGRGLLLRGDGKGGFVPVPGQFSGNRRLGRRARCAAADYDGDGRVDLLVAQNSQETKLYHNVAAKPGLRVRLIGPPGNRARRRRADATDFCRRARRPDAGNSRRRRMLVAGWTDSGVGRAGATGADRSPLARWNDLHFQCPAGRWSDQRQRGKREASPPLRRIGRLSPEEPGIAASRNADADFAFGVGGHIAERITRIGKPTGATRRSGHSWCRGA